MYKMYFSFVRIFGGDFCMNHWKVRLEQDKEFLSEYTGRNFRDIRSMSTKIVSKYGSHTQNLVPEQ
jgi:hypothetical protein